MPPPLHSCNQSPISRPAADEPAIGHRSDLIDQQVRLIGQARQLAQRDPQRKAILALDL
ncbi:hypothetical protein D3C87_2043020 [compost metagenome]